MVAEADDRLILALPNGRILAEVMPLLRRVMAEAAMTFADIDRIATVWQECLDAYGGPYLFGERACTADAMYAPVC